MRSAVRWFLALSSSALAAPLAAACGSRTGLLAPESLKQDVADAAGDGEVDASVDASEDLLEPIDVTFPDVTSADECPDAGSTLIYLLTQQNDLYSFHPLRGVFRLIGPISCPSPAGAMPFSMAVDRRGIGYSVFDDGTLKLLDMATAHCQPTPFRPGQDGFTTFGMGFVANTGDAGETLFVAEGTATPQRPSSRGLATIDTKALRLAFVAPFTPPIPGPELTGTGAGQLFAFYTNAGTVGSHIVQLDPASGAILTDFPLTVGDTTAAYAFAFWGGVFWVFTSPAATSTTTVTRFDPSTREEMTAATLDETVVGAGVSTCAPQ